MKFNRVMQKRVLFHGGAIALNASRWVIRVFADDGTLLGESNPFRFDPGGIAGSIPIIVKATGTLRHAMLIEEDMDDPAIIRVTSRLIKQMSEEKKSDDQILKALDDLLTEKGRIDLDIGLNGKDLNVSSAVVMQGSTLMIDRLSFQLE